MNIKLPLILLFTICFLNSNSQNGLDKREFYEIIEGNSTSRIDEELSKLSNKPQLTAYEGALLMKKSGLMSDPLQKLSVFKSGRNKLESAISQDSNSVELRFLRLIIQENSPKIVQYNQEIKRDASYLRENYFKLQPVVQHALYNFSQTSNALNPEDFKSLKHE